MLYLIERHVPPKEMGMVVPLEEGRIHVGEGALSRNAGLFVEERKTSLQFSVDAYLAKITACYTQFATGTVGEELTLLFGDFSTGIRGELVVDFIRLER